MNSKVSQISQALMVKCLINTFDLNARYRITIIWIRPYGLTYWVHKIRDRRTNRYKEVCLAILYHSSNAKKVALIPKVTHKVIVLTFNCTVTLVFRGFNILTSVFFSGSLGLSFNGGLSFPRRSKTDCLLITFALFTEMKMKIQTINTGKIRLTIGSFSPLLSKANT